MHPLIPGILAFLVVAHITHNELLAVAVAIGAYALTYMRSKHA